MNTIKTNLLCLALLCCAACFFQTPEPILFPKVVADIGSARVVTIGEDVPGVKQHHIYTNSLLRTIIQEKDFNVIVLQSDHDKLQELLVDLKKTVDLNPAMRRSLDPKYCTHEMREFFQWLRERLKAGGSVKLVGEDMRISESFTTRIAEKIRTTGSQQLITEFEWLHKRWSIGPKEAMLILEQQFNKTAYSIAREYDDWRSVIRIDSLYRLTANSDKEVLEGLAQWKIGLGIAEEIRNRKGFRREEDRLAERLAGYLANPETKLIMLSTIAKAANDSMFRQYSSAISFLKSRVADSIILLV